MPKGRFRRPGDPQYKYSGKDWAFGIVIAIGILLVLWFWGT